MFLRCKVRWKDGKQHLYWSVVENTRAAGRRVVQRHVLYLGEINDTQELAWRRSIEALEDGAARPRTLSLFPEDRVQGLLADASIVGVRLSELRLRRPRQWGASWLALMLWRELQLDQFWSKRLGVSRKGTHWAEVLFVLVAYRLLAPGSEWRLHREWFQRSALFAGSRRLGRTDRKTRSSSRRGGGPLPHHVVCECGSSEPSACLK